MTEHFANILFPSSGITRTIIVRIFSNAMKTQGFAEMTKTILLLTRAFTRRTKEI
jgi:hypothetical protein